MRNSPDSQSSVDKIFSNLLWKTDKIVSAARSNTMGSPRPQQSTNHIDQDDPSSSPLLGYSRVRHTHFHAIHSVRNILLSNYVNVLLIFLPLGIIAGALEWNAIAVFVMNFLAIMALASLLSFATEELSKKVGQTIGGLLNASFGNATELIVSIVALRQGQIKLVQASMLGSILSNLLLVFQPISRKMTDNRFWDVVSL